MALRRSNQIANAKNVDEFVLSPREGEAIVIKGIYAYMDKQDYDGFTQSAFLRLFSGKTSVGIIPAAYKGMDYIPISGINSINDMNRFLRLNNINMTYPIPEGSEFVAQGFDITTMAKVNINRIAVIYDVYDSGDIKGTEENGPFSNTLTYMNFLTNSRVVQAGDIAKIDYSYLPAEFPDFPAGIVPSKFRIRLLGITGVGAAYYVDAANYIQTEYIRIFYRRQVMFDDDRHGFPFEFSNNNNLPLDNNNIIYPDPANGKHFYIFPEPLDFFEGDEINIEVLTYGTGSAAIDDRRITLIALMKIFPIS